MKLYKFRTFTTSYYFPNVTKETRFLYGLYSPFGGILSKVYWALFKNFKLVRCFSGIDTKKVDFPYTKIMDVDGTDSILSNNILIREFKEFKEFKGFYNSYISYKN